MTAETEIFWSGLAGLSIGLLLGWPSCRFLFRRLEPEGPSPAEILAAARQQAETLRKEAEAREKILRARYDFGSEARAELDALRRRLKAREKSLNGRLRSLEEREAAAARREERLRAREEALAERLSALERRHQEARRRLSRVLGATAEEAAGILLEEVESDAWREAGERILALRREADREALHRTQKILAAAIKSGAGDFVTESAVTVVALPDEEAKGKIIGREGRNIRFFEAITGVDLLVDDTPASVVLSGHNPVRREIARRALLILLSEGTIRPHTIQEAVRRAQRDLRDWMRAAAEEATQRAGVRDLHPELLGLLGKLRLHRSDSPDVLAHSVTVSLLAGELAAALGWSERQARRAGLLHDIGKALDHKREGSHAVIGAELARRYGGPTEVVNALAAHHGEVEPETLLAALLGAAEELIDSAWALEESRLAESFQRLPEVEGLLASPPLPAKVYALRLGNELRVILETMASEAECAPLPLWVESRLARARFAEAPCRVVTVRTHAAKTDRLNAAVQEDF